MTMPPPGSQSRTADHPIDPLFLDRWSPRAMSGASIDKSQLMSLMEAARWAPSSYNNQPWRILYALRDTEHWQTYMNLLDPFNQKWCEKAGALVLFISKTTFDHNGKPCITHAYDAGAAWENFALQGTRLGLVVHGMQGFDYDKARSILKIPAVYEVQAMAAVGHPAPAETLPEDMRSKEKPSDRRPLEATACEGVFSL